ncbi:hypothetical protein [Deinococcus sonorensis]|uniref:Uncharacterized protein n=2 Tax=Deinococcus sonorensis TaxID=309891 RepID=A0AAU7UGL1_9DEIO
MRTFLLSSVLFGVLSGAALAGAPVSSFPSASPALIAQLTPYGGAGFTDDQANQQVAQADQLLHGMGYGTRAVRGAGAGGRVYRWYHQGTDTTVMAFVDRRDVGRELQFMVLPWRVVWNELTGP